MPSEFAPPGGKPKVTKKQIQQMQENYKRAGELLQDTKAEEDAEKALLEELFEEEFDNVFSEQKKVGIYIGRFQPLHKGHENILKQMIGENDTNIICIGTGGEKEKNPFSYDECEMFFKSYISGNFFVEPIADATEDKEWLKNLLGVIQSHITANSSLTFYGGDFKNDYAIQVIQKYIEELYRSPVSYVEVQRGIFLIEIEGQQVALSASLCREALKEKNTKFLKEALSEHIYYGLHKNQT